MKQEKQEKEVNEKVEQKPVKIAQSEKTGSQDLKKKIKNNRKILCEEISKNRDKTNQAIQDGKRIIIIEVCQNCLAHQYCTHHKEMKYREYFLKIQKEIETNFDNFFVAKNFMIANPRMGAFEVKFNQKIIFSKLSRKHWPKISNVVNSIRNILDIECKENYQNENQYDEKQINTKESNKEQPLKTKIKV